MAFNLLKNICDVIGEEFQEGNVSITTGRVKINTTRRHTPLEGISPTENGYLHVYRVQLFKVVLFINGLSQPLELYRPETPPKEML